MVGDATLTPSLFYNECIVQTDNVMLRLPRGDVVLTDYGLSRISNSGVDVAEYEGNAAGDMLYLAPELIREGHANMYSSDVCVLATLHGERCRYVLSLAIADIHTASFFGASLRGNATHGGTSQEGPPKRRPESSLF